MDECSYFHEMRWMGVPDISNFMISQRSFSSQKATNGIYPKPLHVFKRHFSKTYLNIILLHTPGFPNGKIAQSETCINSFASSHLCPKSHHFNPYDSITHFLALSLLCAY